MKLSVIGLGYVGLPLAVAFAKVVEVIGFDISHDKVQQYRDGIDVTREVGDDAVRTSSALFTSDETLLKECQFHIVAVPTPIHPDKTPDLRPLISASQVLGRNLTKGSIVVYESTVFPGVTEEICVPILEECSGLKCGVDFKVGYSPERINPGDRVHRLETIVKVVSGMDAASLEEIARVYGLIVKAGVHKAPSIKVAEAAKVIENSQRDINIAFMNELSIIFNQMGVDTKEVIHAAKTKWNFLDFSPGLVGGHCIGVDPYYLTYKAEQIGYHSQIILSGRRINDHMGKYVAENTVKKMIHAGISIKDAIVAIYGVTFKENCPDVRNTKVVDIIKELEEYGIQTVVVDPVADRSDLEKEYGIQVVEEKDVGKVDAVIIAVSHDAFLGLSLPQWKEVYRTDTHVLIDVKGIHDRKDAQDHGFLYWRL